MTVFYFITFIISLILIFVYFRVDKERNLSLMLLFVSIALCNWGYFALSISKSLTAALIWNSLAYLGNILLPFFLLMMVIRLSGLSICKAAVSVLVAANLLMFFIASSGGYLPIYYSDVSLSVTDGVARLIKEYGPLHGFYKVFLMAYFVGILAVIIYSAVKKTAVSTKHSMFLAIVLCGNIALWLAENIMEVKYEFLTISYLMTEGLILLLYGILQDFNSSVSTAAESVERSFPPSDDAALQSQEIRYYAAADALNDEQIRAVLSEWPAVMSLTQREREVLRFIFEKRRRKEIAQVLFVSDSTVKKHTSNIFKKLGVANRAELFIKAEQYLQ